MSLLAGPSRCGSGFGVFLELRLLPAPLACRRPCCSGPGGPDLRSLQILACPGPPATFAFPVSSTRSPNLAHLHAPHLDGACLLPSPAPICAPSELFSIRRLRNLFPPRPFSSKRKHITKLVFFICYLSVILGTAYLHPRLSLCYLSVIPGKTPAALTWRKNEADLNFCRQHTEQRGTRSLAEARQTNSISGRRRKFTRLRCINRAEARRPRG